MSSYDETTDKLATELQRKVAAHIEALDGAEAPACFHQNYRDFYDSARVDMSALLVRARSRDYNQQTIQQAETLPESLNAFEALHKLKSARGACLSSQELRPVQQGFDQHLGAMLRLEFAKRRGAS
jgi:hypothetical protein